MMIEAGCRAARSIAAGNDTLSFLFRGLRRYLAAVNMHDLGLHGVGRALAESAAGDMVSAAPSLWPIASFTSLCVTWMAHREYVAAHDERFAPAPESLWEALQRPPLLWPIMILLEWTREIVSLIPALPHMALAGAPDSK